MHHSKSMQKWHVDMQCIWGLVLQAKFNLSFSQISEISHKKKKKKAEWFTWAFWHGVVWGHACVAAKSDAPLSLPPRGGWVRGQPGQTAVVAPCSQACSSCPCREAEIWALQTSSATRRDISTKAERECQFLRLKCDTFTKMKHEREIIFCHFPDLVAFCYSHSK